DHHFDDRHRPARGRPRQVHGKPRGHRSVHGRVLPRRVDEPGRPDSDRHRSPVSAQMIPLKRAFDEKRRLVIPVAAGLAINLLLFIGVVYPMRATVRNAEQRAETSATALAAAQREDQSARALVESKTRTSTSLQTFYHDV